MVNFVGKKHIFAFIFLVAIIFANKATADGGSCAATNVLGSAQLPAFGGVNLEIVGDRLFVAGSFDGLHIFDIEDPTNPVLISTTATGWSAQDVAINGNVAYLAVGILGVESYDISDPFNPQFLDRYDTPGFAFGIVASGGHVYIADDSTLQILDTTDPAAMQFESSFSSNAFGIQINNLLVYLASGSVVDIVDVSDSSAPALVSSIVREGASHDFVHYDQGKLYLRTPNFIGIEIHDVSIPSSPAFLGEIELGGAQVFGVFAQGDLMYSASSDGGGTTSHDLTVVDVSDPSTPKPLGFYDEIQVGTQRVIANDSGVIYSLNSNRGIRSFDFVLSTCPADLTGDCLLDFFDVSSFLTSFSIQDPVADRTGDGVWDFFDISAYLTELSVGCP